MARRTRKELKARVRSLEHAIDLLYKTVNHRCGVCLGHSPSWDGHDVNPPCYGYAIENLERVRNG